MEVGGDAVADVSRGDGGGGEGEGLWSRGWRLGKRIALAGAIISSAPVVVPPLLLLSAVALAFSVPFGVLSAGYACTDKIMQALLPLPVPSSGAPQPEAEELEEAGEGEEQEEGEADHQFREVGAETEQEEDLVEEFPEVEEGPVAAYEKGGQQEEAAEGEEQEEGEEDYHFREVGAETEQEEELVEELPEVEEGPVAAYEEGGQQEEAAEGEEQDHQFLEVGAETEQEKELVEELPELEEGPVAAYEEGGQQEEEMPQQDQGEGVITDAREEERGKEERLVVPPPIADESVSSAPEREEKRAEGVEEEKEAEEGEHGKEEGVAALAGANVERVSAPQEVGKQVQEKALKDKRQVEEELVKEGEVARTIAVEGVPSSPEGDDILGDERGIEDKGQVKDGKEKPAEEQVVPLNIGKESIPAAGPENREEERQVPEAKEVTMIPAVAGEGSISAPEAEEKRVEEKDVEEVRAERQGLISVVRVERETLVASEGEDSPVASPAVLQISVVEHEILIEPSSVSPEYTSAVEQQLSDVPHAERAGSLEHPQLQQGSDAVMVSQGYDEDLHSEEKIWEQIDAIRTIVGYRAPPHSSCVQELKALYLFIGVKPSISVEESFGLEEVKNKLRFLKSIIGVK